VSSPKALFWPSLKALLLQASSKFTHLMQQELSLKLTAMASNAPEDEDDDFEYAAGIEVDQ